MTGLAETSVRQITAAANIQCKSCRPSCFYSETKNLDKAVTKTGLLL